jgi:hypothetical protein
MVNFYKEVIKHIKMEPEGQLSQEERLFLRNLVIQKKPRKILESGTWKGGGSTLSLVKGLYENGIGLLETFEEHEPFHLIAKNYYTNSIYKPYIKLYNGTFLFEVEKFSDDYYEDLDLVFLDGGDESPNGSHKLNVSDYLQDYNVSENLQSFIYLSKKIKPNTIVALHDWSITEGRGNFVKRYLQDNNFEGFELLQVVEGSTGLAILIKK